MDGFPMDCSGRQIGQVSLTLNYYASDSLRFMANYVLTGAPDRRQT